MAGIIDKFRVVAGERLQQLSHGLVQLEQDPNPEHLRGLLRELHTLKGEAGVLGLKPLSLLAHAMEDLLGATQHGTLEISGELFDLALASIDAMASLVAGGEPGPALELTAQIREQLKGAERDPSPPAAAHTKGAERDPPPQRATHAVADALVAPPNMALPEPQRARQVLRIDPERLGGLSELAGDLLVFRDRSDRRAKELESLFLDLRKQAGVDSELLNRLESVAKQAGEDAFQEARRVRDLGEQLRQLRLGPVRELLEGYQRTVRDLARSLGKQIQLEIKAEAVEVDQSVLELLNEPLLHLIRNSVSHGIEAPELRSEKGKSSVGRLTLSVHQVGSSVEIAVSDDGGGIDPGHLRMVAEMRGILTPEAAEGLEPGEALDLIFRPGFSTAEVSEISGRGIGLDVVRRRVEEHQGEVRVESEPDVGTTFIVRIPMDVAMARALICESGGCHYAISAESIERVIRYEPSARQPLGEREGLRVDGVTLPIHYLGRASAQAVEGAPVVLVRARDRVMALMPDRVLGQRDVAYRPLDPFINEAETVQSSCVLLDGSIALLVSPAGLLARAGEDRVARAPRAQQPATSRTVLVVEDSPITRELVTEIVRNAGYQAVAAEDGLSALDRIAQSKPDLILTDLEMPRLNGVELTRKLRAQPGDVRIPIVIITTRASPEERRACMQAGADAFLDKSKFHEGQLLETVRRLIG